MKTEVAVSSDIIGIWGKVEDLKFIYGDFTDKLELIGWSFTLDSHLQEAKQLGYRIINIHGRLTSYYSPEPIQRKIPVLLGSYLIASTPRLVKEYSRDHDILLHAPVIHDPRNLRCLISNKDKIKFLWMENDNNGLFGAIEAIELTRKLRAHGVNTGLNFDLSHFIGPHSLRGSAFPGQWKKTIIYIHEHILNLTDLKGETIPLSFHFPIGTNPFDTLPVIPDMTIDMLRELADILKSGRIQRLVIENQLSRLNLIKINRNNLGEIKERTMKILDKANAAGIL